MTELQKSERETHLNQSGDDHSKWIVFTDDPFWIRRLDKIAVAVRAEGDGEYYELDKSQVSLRKKRVVTPAMRAMYRKNARRLQNVNGNGGNGAQTE